MKHNKNIHCNVHECKNHSKGYCTLDKIEVKKHNSKCTSQEHTDCASFEK